MENRNLNRLKQGLNYPSQDPENSFATRIRQQTNQEIDR